MSKNTQFWKWPEYRHTDPEKDWTTASIITAGIDIGSVGSKVAIMLDGELYAYSVMRTGGVSEATSVKATEWALKETGEKLKAANIDVTYIYGSTCDCTCECQLISNTNDNAKAAKVLS